MPPCAAAGRRAMLKANKDGRGMTQRERHIRSAVIIGLMLAQTACAAYFLFDVTRDYLTEAYGPALSSHLVMETLANVVLAGAIALEAAYLRRLLRQQAHDERILSAASGALRDAMQAYFDDWSLTPAEAAVAELVIRGMSISDIAAQRGSAEGTIKTQLNAVYRKAGVSGRNQLVSVLVGELLEGALAEKPA